MLFQIVSASKNKTFAGINFFFLRILLFCGSTDILKVFFVSRFTSSLFWTLYIIPWSCWKADKFVILPEILCLDQLQKYYFLGFSCKIQELVTPPWVPTDAGANPTLINNTEVDHCCGRDYFLFSRSWSQVLIAAPELLLHTSGLWFYEYKWKTPPPLFSLFTYQLWWPVLMAAERWGDLWPLPALWEQDILFFSRQLLYRLRSVIRYLDTLCQSWENRGPNRQRHILCVPPSSHTAVRHWFHFQDIIHCR